MAYRLDEIVRSAGVRTTKKWRDNMAEYYEETAKQMELYKRSYINVALGSNELCSIFNARSIPVRVSSIYDVEPSVIAWTKKLKQDVVITHNGVDLKVIKRNAGGLVAVREEDVVTYYPHGCSNQPNTISRLEASEINLHRCHQHNVLVPGGSLYRVGGRYYCTEAHRELFAWCPACNASVLREEAVQCSVSGDHCCARCVQDYTTHIVQHGKNSFCRSYGAPQRSILLGKIYKSRRLVGCEIEASRNDSSARTKCARDLPVEVGISGDDSVLNGDEFITPPASGKDAERLVTGVCKVIKKHSWSVNDTCGLHIHLNVEDFKKSPKLLSQLFATYYYLEETIQQWVHPRRRSSRHARLLSCNYSPAMVQHLIDHPEDFTIFTYSPDDYKRSKEEKEMITRELLVSRASCKRDDSRYKAFNFHAVYYHGTFEVRMHEGTLDDKTILHWMNLHAKIMNYAKTNFDLSELRAINSIKDVDRRIEALAAAVGLEKATLKFWKKKISCERV